MNMKNLIPNLLNRFIGNPALSSIVSLGVLVLISLPASAATFTVNSLDDNGVGDCDGITCTLRDALSESVTDGEPSVIDFAPGLSGVITLQQGELNVGGSDLDIQGPGPELITVSGNITSRVFHFNSSASTISLSGLTITDGYVSSGKGAGIYVRGEDIVLENLRVINNTTGFI
ncbi:MAG: CSLREA domain-containing protein, partial [Proteobacteria bacterium]